MKYELALVLSAKIEDEERAAMVEKVQKKYEAAQRCLQAIENLRSGLLQQLFI